MTRSKLSHLEKQEIFSCFEQQQATIPDLAERYQVSASTIRRLLKQLAVDAAQAAAEALIVVTPFNPEQVTEPLTPAENTVLDKKPKLISKRSISTPQAPQQESLDYSVSSGQVGSRAIAPPTLRAFREEPQDNRSETSHRSSRSPEDDWNESQPIGFHDTPSAAISGLERVEPPKLRAVSPPQDEMSAILEDLGNSLTSAFTSSASEEDDDDSEDFDDEDYDADDEDGEDFSLIDQALQLQSEVLVEVMPFEQAVLPKVCYIVVDRTAELVTRPLKDFGELGQIPAHEVQSCTLPIFDNHRIARRFSHRNQRIIKVPNGNMLRATCTQLSAKGITRLLINGQIYAL
jgi:transposase-like protein